jgi:hypothetical protein
MGHLNAEVTRRHGRIAGRGFRKIKQDQTGVRK